LFREDCSNSAIRTAYGGACSRFARSDSRNSQGGRSWAARLSIWRDRESRKPPLRSQTPRPLRTPGSYRPADPGKRSARRPTNFGERFASKRSFNGICDSAQFAKRRHRRRENRRFPGTGNHPGFHPRSSRRQAVKAAIEKLPARTYSANTGEFEAMKSLAMAIH